MFITGPDVIKTVTGEEVEFEELGGAMTPQHEVGRRALRRRRRGRVPRGHALPHVSFLPAEQPRDGAARRCPPTTRTGWTRSSTRSSPTTRTSPTTCATSSGCVVDDGEFFEIHEHYAKNIVCGFARLDGYAVGVVGNQPAHDGRRARHRRVAPRPRASCAPATPSTSRSSPSATSPASCPAPRRSGAASSATAPSCSTPTPRRPSRRSRSSRARPTAAPTTSWPPSTCWPTSTSPGRRPRSRSWAPRARSTSSTAATSPTSPTPEERRAEAHRRLQGALRQPVHGGRARLHRRRHRPHETRPKVITALHTLLTKREPGPKRKHGNMISPAETRPKVINAFETLLTKRDPGPKRKHGNIPL